MQAQTREQAKTIFTFGRRMRTYMFKAMLQARSRQSAPAHEDLSPSQIHMLMVINTRQKCTISELAGLLDVSPPSVSAMVERLVEKGALVRERSREDRRVVVVRLAEHAARQLTAIEEAMLESFVNIVERVGPELTGRWCALVEDLNEALGEDYR